MNETDDSARRSGGGENAVPEGRCGSRLLKALLGLPNPIFTVTPDLRLEPANAAGRRIAQNWLPEDPLPGELRERARQVMTDGRDQLPVQFQEALVWRENNEARYFLPQLLALRDEQQGIAGVVVMLEDVTQFRLADELRSNFVSTVSHEIKTPLTSVRMAVHMLQAEMVGPLEPRQAALLNTAREDIERLLRLLNNLLDLAHFEEGAPQMSWEKICVCELVDEAVKEVQTLLATRNLSVKVECPEGLPDLYIDRARIHHVLRNLLTNAIKHSPENDEILLSVGLADNGGIQFSVRDRGPGIPDEHIGRIFERFYRVPGQKTHGTGLGLSIAREIILAHTGNISCRSEPGRQTVFHFTLPTALEQERRLAAKEHSPKG